MGSLTGKGKKLVDEMKRRRIGIMGTQETKWGGNSARGGLAPSAPLSLKCPPIVVPHCTTQSVSGHDADVKD